MSEIFPVSGHATVDPWRAAGEAHRLGHTPAPPDSAGSGRPDAGKVFAVTALGTGAGYLGAIRLLSEVCWDNCVRQSDDSHLAILAMASAVGLPPLAAHLAGGHGGWALLGSAAGLVGGAYIGGAVGDGWGGGLALFAIHTSVTALFALK